MRHKRGWTLALLGLTQLVTTAGAGASINLTPVADRAAASERAAPAAEAAPPLDLRIMPRQPLVAPASPIAPAALAAEPLDRFGAFRSESAERGLSFGFEVRRRPQLERRAWQDEEDAPGLRDNLERAIEHSTLGVRGTYRF